MRSSHLECGSGDTCSARAVISRIEHYRLLLLCKLDCPGGSPIWCVRPAAHLALNLLRGASYKNIKAAGLTLGWSPEALLRLCSGR